MKLHRFAMLAFGIFVVGLACQQSRKKTLPTTEAVTPTEDEEGASQEDAFAQSVEELRNEGPFDFHQEFLNFKQAIADFKKSEAYLNPQTDEEKLMAIQADNMENLTEEFLIQQIKEKKFDTYNHRLQNMDEITAKTEEIIVENFTDPNALPTGAEDETTETINSTTADSPNVVAGTTEEQQNTEVVSEEPSMEDTNHLAAGNSEPASQKRTKFQHTAGIVAIVMGSLGALTVGKIVSTPHDSLEPNKRGAGTLALLSITALTLGLLIINNDDKNDIDKKGKKLLIGAAAVWSGMMSVRNLNFAITGTALHYDQLRHPVYYEDTQSSTKTKALKESLNRYKSSFVAGLLFAGLAAGLAVYGINHLDLAEQQYTPVQTFESQVARTFVIASYMSENNIDPTKRP